MLRTLRSKLLFYFLVVSLTGIIFISSAIHLGLHDAFSSYLNLKRQEQIQQVIELFEAEYEQQEFISGENAIMLLHQQAMNEMLFYQVRDLDGSLILDSTNLLHMGMMHNMHSMMRERNSKVAELDNLLTDTYPLEVNDSKVGTVIVYYEKEYVEADIHFLGRINQYILGASLTMLILSVITSLVLSKKLTSGLTQMRHAAHQLQRRNLGVRIKPDAQQTEEIQELSEAFNDLAYSLERHEKLRKQFTGDLAHELRTPLATLRSQLEAFKDGVWEPTAERLDQSHGELMRLVRLVNDLEKLLAAENPQIQLQLDQVNAEKLLDWIYQYFTPAFSEKGVTLTIKEMREPLRILADEDRVKQILTNLINNALKYTPTGGSVVISLQKKHHMALFQIEDTGSGISSEDLPHIFERFYRGDKSRNRNTGGTGIGLSVVNALVEAHKGKIQIESDLGKGTKARVHLPLKGTK
ncbi:signal transduction histidine kinase [Desulfitispora alkaliphila]|uniref:sensor histidine kinase n=1 Tax=Desulfitispora alkaliphila TaxID=622674 RepID=UPI003D1E1389